MRDEELNGGHVHTSADRWMGLVMVRHLEPGIYIKQNLNHLSRRLIFMSYLIQKKSGTGICRSRPSVSLGQGQSGDPWLGVVTIVVEGVGIGVIIAMDLVELVEEIHREIMNQKLVISVAEMAIEDAMFVMAQEKIQNRHNSTR